jgi:WD40 repeat protein
MPKQTKTQDRSIARLGERALAVQSAALVRRGLRDLARESNWVVKKLFTRRIPDLSVSPAGQVCVTSHDLRAGRPRISVFDAELAAAAFNFDVPWTELPPRTLSDCDSATAFAWSPCGRYIAGSCPDWPRQIHFFDVQRKSYVRSLELLSQLPASLAWSHSGRHFAASYAGGAQAAIHLWFAHTGQIPEGTPVAKHAGIPSFQSTAEDGVGDEGTFRGYGHIAFSPDERHLAAVIKFEEEWADDSIMIASLPSLEPVGVIHASGTVTDVAWTPDNRQLVICAAGQTYLQTIASIWSEDPLVLPFGAEICRSHPTLRVVAGFCSWLKSSAKGRLFLADLSDGTILDECPAEGVIDVRWSSDGLKLYAVMQDGLAYIYDHPLI